MAALCDTPAPVNLKIYDTHIPRSLADGLVQFSAQKNTSEKTYEYFYVQRPETALRPAVNDTFVCEMQPELAFLPLEHEEKAPEPERESQAAILRTAMAYIHETFPAKFCLWADDLKGQYWTYGLCSGDKIVQYHDGGTVQDRETKRVPEQPKTVFVLGRYSKASVGEVLLENQVDKRQYAAYVRSAGRDAMLVDEKAAPYTHHQVQKAVLQLVLDGSVCKDTGRPRAVEVVYKCDSSGLQYPFIIDVVEYKTCHYKMFVHVPRLCLYEPFLPLKDSQKEPVDVRCQRLGSTGEMDRLVLASFDEYSQNTVLRAHPHFPVRADNHIDIADHQIVPLGRGFYFARSKRQFHTPSTYFKLRNVVLFNGVYLSLNDLNTQFAKMLYSCIGTSLLAPHGLTLLDWNHSFLMWFEIYDYNGDFLALTRVEHDATTDKHALKAQLLDPFSLLDVEGDVLKMVPFQRPAFEAPNDMWNFETFSELGAAILDRHRLIQQHMAKESKETKDSQNDDGEFRLIMVYNRGVLDGSLMKMDLLDEKTGYVLDGKYEDNGDYLFDIESDGGFIYSLGIPSIEPERNFMQITVKVGPDPVYVDYDEDDEDDVFEDAPVETEKPKENVADETIVNTNHIEANIPENHGNEWLHDTNIQQNHVEESQSHPEPDAVNIEESSSLNSQPGDNNDFDEKNEINQLNQHVMQLEPENVQVNEQTENSASLDVDSPETEKHHFPEGIVPPHQVVLSTEEVHDSLEQRIDSSEEKAINEGADKKPEIEIHLASPEVSSEQHNLDSSEKENTKQEDLVETENHQIIPPIKEDTQVILEQRYEQADGEKSKEQQDEQADMNNNEVVFHKAEENQVSLDQQPISLYDEKNEGDYYTLEIEKPQTIPPNQEEEHVHSEKHHPETSTEDETFPDPENQIEIENHRHTEENIVHAEIAGSSEETTNGWANRQPEIETPQAVGNDGSSEQHHADSSEETTNKVVQAEAESHDDSGRNEVAIDHVESVENTILEEEKVKPTDEQVLQLETENLGHETGGQAETSESIKEEEVSIPSINENVYSTESGEIGDQNEVEGEAKVRVDLDFHGQSQVESLEQVAAGSDTASLHLQREAHTENIEAENLHEGVGEKHAHQPLSEVELEKDEL